MSLSFDVAAVGNAIVDVLAPASEEFLQQQALVKGAMTLIDAGRANALYAEMAAGVEASGGSAGNTTAGVASLGGRAAYIGKVADDPLGAVFQHDINATGVYVRPSAFGDGEDLGTGRCLISVTPDGQRTMCTYLGVANALAPEDIDAEVLAAAKIVYLEGYLFDPNLAREAFVKAAGVAREAGRSIALTLSDAFVVERHRADLLSFVESHVDVVFANEVEAMAMFQTSDFDQAASALGAKANLVAITRGEQGSVIVSNGERIDLAAEPVGNVVDTTGAGDQYAAGVLFGLTRDLPLHVCGRLGGLSAAEVIGHFGPRPQTPLKALAQAAGLI